DGIVRDINEREARIDNNAAQATQARSSIAQIETRRSELDREIPGVSAQIGRANSELASANAQVASATNSLENARRQEAAALAAFETRLQRYNLELAKAESLGATQA